MGLQAKPVHTDLEDLLITVTVTVISVPQNKSSARADQW